MCEFDKIELVFGDGSIYDYEIPPFFSEIDYDSLLHRITLLQNNEKGVNICHATLLTEKPNNYDTESFVIHYKDKKKLMSKIEKIIY